MKHMKHLLVAAACLLLTPAAASANEIPSGSEIAEGIAVHMTPKGIDFLEAQIPAIVPASMPVPEMSGTLFSCFLDTADYRVKNVVVYIDITNVQITPIEGALTLHLEANVAATGRIETNGCLFNNGCNVSIASSPMVADTIIDMAMVPDPQTNRPMVDATVQQFAVAMALADPDFSGCTLAGFFDFLVGLFSGSIEDAVIGALQGQIAPILEPTIEDAFNSMNLAGSLDLGGTPVDYDFYPTALEIHPGTIGIVMGGGFSTDQVAACADPARGSWYTAGALPIYTDLSPVSSQAYDAALSVADDVLNQLVFSAWRGGLLCRDVADMGGEPLTTELLSLIGGSLSKIVTPNGPMIIRITAPDPPLVTLGGGNLANLSLSNLQIDIMADVEQRLARVMRLQLSPTAGLNIELTGGQILTSLNFDPANVEATIEYNELAPDANEAVMSLLPTLVEQLLPSLTDAIPPIDVSNLGGITIDMAEITPDGPQQDFLSAYTALGGQMQAGGCGAGGTGCGVGGGGLGCTIGARGMANPLVMAFLFLGSVGTVAYRRRRE